MHPLLSDLFSIPTPYQGDLPPNDPLFAVYARHVRGVDSPEALRRYTLRAVRLTAGTLFAFAALFAAYSWWGSTFSNFTRAMTIALLLTTAALIGIGFILDFFCILYGISGLRRLQNPATLDLLRLATIKLHQVVLAQYQVGMLYAWRLVVFMLAARMVVVIGWVLLVGTVILSELPSSSRAYDKGAMLGFALSLTLSLSYFFVYETFWRYRVMTAIGIRQAAQHRNNLSVWSWTLLSVIGFWMLQMGIAVVGGAVFGIIGVTIVGLMVSIARVFPDWSATFWIFLSTFIAGFAPLGFALMIRASQSDFINESSLNSSVRSLFMDDSQ